MGTNREIFLYILDKINYIRLTNRIYHAITDCFDCLKTRHKQRLGGENNK